MRPRDALRHSLGIGLAAAATLCACSAGSGLSSPVAAPTPVPTTAANLVVDPRFDEVYDARGIAQGVTEWGAAQLSLVSTPVAAGGLAEQLDVPSGQVGGMYLQLPAQPDMAYTQSAYLDVKALSPNASVALIVEWYDSSLRLLGYQLYPINLPDRAYRRRVQSARSPPGTAALRFVVNIRGGGRVLINGPRLQIGL